MGIENLQPRYNDLANQKLTLNNLLLIRHQTCIESFFMLICFGVLPVIMIFQFFQRNNDEIFSHKVVFDLLEFCLIITGGCVFMFFGLEVFC